MEVINISKKEKRFRIYPYISEIPYINNPIYFYRLCDIVDIQNQIEKGKTGKSRRRKAMGLKREQ
jgi:hypothetical protein